MVQDRPGMEAAADRPAVRSLAARERDIVHLDVAAFAVAVERVRDPRLVGRPVVVAPPTPRGVVHTASLEAHRAGIRRGMPLARAVRVCRDVLVLTPDEPLYARAAAAVRAILSRFTPLVEPASGGRWYLDLTGTRRLFGPPIDTAARLVREVRGDLRLQAAVGLAVNKTVSRVAADVTVPTGLVDVPHGDEARFLAPLPAIRLPGVVGDVRGALSDLNIRIVREIAAIGSGPLTMLFGRFGIVLHQRALGIDPTPVRVPEEEPAIFDEAFFAEDTNDRRAIESSLFELAGRLALALRRRGVTAERIEILITYADGERAAARTDLREPTDLDPRLFDDALRLLARALTRRVRVRGLALRATGLARRPRQLSLFGEEAYRRDARLTAALTTLRAKHGPRAVVFAGRRAASRLVEGREGAPSRGSAGRRSSGPTAGSGRQVTQGGGGGTSRGGHKELAGEMSDGTDGGAGERSEGKTTGEEVGKQRAEKGMEGKRPMRRRGAPAEGPREERARARREERAEGRREERTEGRGAERTEEQMQGVRDAPSSGVRGPDGARREGRGP